MHVSRAGSSPLVFNMTSGQVSPTAHLVTRNLTTISPGHWSLMLIAIKLLPERLRMQSSLVFRGPIGLSPDSHTTQL
jgi:hypothetical protein